MLKQYLATITLQNPELGGAVMPVVEKELLHHDIMHVMMKQGALQGLTFIGGTSLRLCYNSSRLSEDLDFNGGHNFKPADLDGLENDIQAYIENKYDTRVSVYKPNPDKQGDTSSWKISIEKEAGRPDLPRQKMHIDICAIPSFDIQRRPLINHYRVNLPTTGLLVPVQSLSETYVDKFIALAYRARRIKPRDVWDIAWLKQQGVSLNDSLLSNKLEARGKARADFVEALSVQVDKLTAQGGEERDDFISEMTRFVPTVVKSRTLDNPDYWPYVQNLIADEARPLLSDAAEDQDDMEFNMGM
ncbi:nucleotidyl transferase AbiEii/AbiGii toxin family protein [Aliagarivorans taiwanensis]|uniref:nucleotidyl transferase AbiEii/AbiGii toxin family protein n=1 Tax=Aliagarivorans taiwanensis TaxID=561966 RepID=UPI00041D719B|nr:nucleotidyl transferase AbiEii/AbiGii toxin family protein [Aliagarivorans taiwanensis]